ncbi:MAG: cytochrome c [Gammaproteobacteria bacterium]|nr:cytochrome c [Gammaproteobacteria bacterium]
MKIFTHLIFGSFFLFLNPAQAAEADGKILHNEHCLKCHNSDIYTRTPRRVNTLPALGKQVRFCKDNLGITWFDEDVDHVVQYLNKNYYKF